MAALGVGVPLGQWERGPGDWEVLPEQLLGGTRACRALAVCDSRDSASLAANPRCQPWGCGMWVAAGMEPALWLCSDLAST